MLKYLIFALFLVLQPFQSSARVDLIEQQDHIIVKNSANLVLTGNYSSIISLIENQEHLFERVIETSYESDIKNFDNVLKFIQDCPETYQASGYEAIFKAMERSGHLWTRQGFKLAYAISRFDSDWPLADKFPETIYKLYFFHNGNCLLKNLEFNKYYYAAVAHYAYDKRRRRNFCWIKGTYSKDAVYDVRVVADDVFTLRNAYVDEYLYAEEALYAHSTERRRVFTFRVKPVRPVGSEWKFEPQPDGQNVIKIRNTRYNELLFADRDVKYNKNRREVFTERINGHAGERWTLWSLEC